MGFLILDVWIEGATTVLILIAVWLQKVIKYWCDCILRTSCTSTTRRKMLVGDN